MSKSKVISSARDEYVFDEASEEYHPKSSMQENTWRHKPPALGPHVRGEETGRRTTFHKPGGDPYIPKGR